MARRVQVRARAICVALPSALACTPDTRSGSETEAGTQSGTEVGPGSETDTGDPEGETGEQVCYDEGSYIDLRPPLDCMLEKPCPSVGFTFKAFECDTPEYDAAAAACVIDALRAKTPGFHSLQDCKLGKYNSHIRLQVFDDGTVLHHQLDNTCGKPSEYRETWRILPEPAYFDACDITTGAGFGMCIEGILDQDCVLGEPSCP